jgi:hypothetical protein
MAEFQPCLLAAVISLTSQTQFQYSHRTNVFFLLNFLKNDDGSNAFADCTSQHGSTTASATQTWKSPKTNIVKGL